MADTPYEEPDWVKDPKEVLKRVRKSLGTPPLLSITERAEACAKDHELIEQIIRHRLSVMFEEDHPHYISISDAGSMVLVSAENDKITDWRDAVLFALNEIEMAQ